MYNLIIMLVRKIKYYIDNVYYMLNILQLYIIQNVIVCNLYITYKNIMFLNILHNEMDL